jgi:serine/threonine protein kinase
MRYRRDSRASAVCRSVQRLAAYGEPVEGTPFGRYRLIELLGRGGMGEVWRAHDTATNNRTVAIKLLPPQLATDRTFVQRFRREADAAARLNNPHIIPIHTYGEIDGRLYVDMRLIEGRDLQEVLADGPLEPGRAVRIIEQVAKALHAAHKIGLVHRDVKPSNILLDEDDFAYLIDFGIARAADETRLTGTGGMIGSWHYMSPERLQAGQVDARADIYALACVLYECLTGSTPFPGDSLEQQITAHLMAPPPRPSSTDPNVPATFDRVIATGMAKDPDQRYATTVDLADAAHDAITTPIRQPVPPPTRPAPNLHDDELPRTLAAQPPSVPPTTPAWAAQPRAPRPSQPLQSRSRSKIWAGVGLAAALVVATAVGVALTNHHSSAPSTVPLIPSTTSFAAPSPATTSESAAPTSTQITGANGTPYTVEGLILAKYQSLSFGVRMDLGAPVDNQKKTLDGSGVYQQFEGGILIYRTGSPVFFVWGKIRDAWNAERASQGQLGYPTADEQILSDGVYKQTFEHGMISWKTGDAEATVTTS